MTKLKKKIVTNSKKKLWLLKKEIVTKLIKKNCVENQTKNCDKKK